MPLLGRHVPLYTRNKKGRLFSKSAEPIYVPQKLNRFPFEHSTTLQPVEAVAGLQTFTFTFVSLILLNHWVWIYKKVNKLVLLIFLCTFAFFHPNRFMIVVIWLVQERKHTSALLFPPVAKDLNILSSCMSAGIRPHQREAVNVIPPTWMPLYGFHLALCLSSFYHKNKLTHIKDMFVLLVVRTTKQGSDKCNLLHFLLCCTILWE